MNHIDTWQGLGHEIIDALSSKSREKLIKKGDYLYHSDEIPKGIYILKSGLVGLVAINCEGVERILRLFSSGQCLSHRGLLAEDSYHASAVVLEDSTFLFIDKNDLEKMFDKYPRLLRHLARKLAIELGFAEKKLLNLTNKRVEQRVAETILFLKSRYPEHLWTRREIAEFCGTTTATVIRTLGKFEKQELIKQNRRQFSILDIEALKELAVEDGCSSQRTNI